MQNEPQRMVVTPQGITIEDSSANYASRTWEMARRIWLLVRWNMRKRVYDKSTGALFLIVEPMLQALLFFYIVYVVFGVRGDDVSYVSIFTLVTLWRGHVLITTSAPYYLSGQGAILQQTRYPPIALILEGIGTDTALFLMLIVIVLAILLLAGEGPRVTWLAFPLVLFVNLVFSAGCAILTACAGVFFRELGLVMNFAVTLWMYASPVVYGMERISEPYRTIYNWTNPFAHIMPAYRQTLLAGEWPQLMPLLVITAISVAMIALGLAWVSSLRGRLYRYL